MGLVTFAVRPMAALFLLVAALPPSGAEAQSKLDARIFQGRSESETASFLVVMREQADLSGAAAFEEKGERGRFVFESLRRHAEATQSSLRERLGAAGVPFRPFFLVNMIEVEANLSLALELAEREDVARVAANLPVTLSRPEPALADAASHALRLTPSAIEPNLVKIRAPEVWQRGFTGEGMVVAVADTGFAWDHPALRDHYRGFDGSAVSHDYNWHDAIHAARAGNPCGSNSPEPCDDEGHGTSVAGLIVGDDGGENRIGVAPAARVIGCRNMDREVGTPATYTECFQFFLAPTDRSGGNPQPDLAPHIINNSWSCPPQEGCTDPDILRTVVENVRAAGIFVVAAAGNEGGQCSSLREAPAIYEASFTVGATTISDTIASFSSRGPVLRDGSNRLKPNLVAPGVGVRASSPPDRYRAFTGTSAASPQVAGAVALLWSAAPELVGGVEETEQHLARGAVPLTSNQGCGGFSAEAVPNPVFGWGRLDVATAVEMVRPLARAAPRVPAPSRPLPRDIFRAREGSLTGSREAPSRSPK